MKVDVATVQRRAPRRSRLPAMVASTYVGPVTGLVHAQPDVEASRADVHALDQQRHDAHLFGWGAAQTASS